MSRKSRNYRSEENDANGSWYQELVAKHFEKITGQPAIVKETHGIDVVCAEYSLEVKGMKNLFKKPTKTGRTQVNCWKVDQTDCPDVTHFVYVLNEEFINSQPLIYVVAIEDIKKRFAEKPNSKWVFFPLHWVFGHLIFKLSRITEKGGN